MGHRGAGNLIVVERRGGPVYYAKWRVADGTQVKRRLGPAWLERTRTGDWKRRRGQRDDDPVFCGAVGDHLDASALRRRYATAAKSAELRPLPFHSLRHHFGSIAVNRATLVQVQAWMGHSHIQTTARYLHHRSQATDAALLADAFGTSSFRSPEGAVPSERDPRSTR